MKNDSVLRASTVLVLQKTKVQFLESTLGGSQPSRNSGLGGFGPLTSTNTSIHMHIPTQIIFF